MPLAGGPSDKAGNSYERRWTVFAMLDLLDGRATTLRIEVPGAEGVGSEFRLMVGGRPELASGETAALRRTVIVSALNRRPLGPPAVVLLSRLRR